MPLQEFCKQRIGELKIHPSEDLGKEGALKHDEVL